ncbi:hypothetical protein MMC11_004465 [Xylographa trunciseda]|nr:hypothetical protein [Xylographa trunciseda]
MTTLASPRTVIQLRHNIVLGPYQNEKDAPRLTVYMNDKTVTRNFGTILPDVYTAANALEFLNRDGYRLRYSIRSLEQDDSLVGDIAIFPTGSLGYWLAPELWNKGIMTQAVGELIREAKSMGFDKITADAFTFNPSSRAVLIKNGFAFTGEGVDNPKGLLAWKYELDLSTKS